MGTFFLLSEEFSNILFVHMESKIPVVSISDVCALSFKKAHGSLAPLLHLLLALSVQYQLFLDGLGEEQGIGNGKVQPPAKAIRQWHLFPLLFQGGGG